MERVLIVAAHPDDEVLGCGGTIRRFRNTGCEVGVFILGKGPTSREPDSTPGRLQEIKDTTSLETKAVSRLLSYELVDYPEVSWPDFKDNRFDTLPNLDVTKVVEAALESYRPDVVFTHWFWDLNVDHHAVSRAVATATRPYPGQVVKEVYQFETPSSTEWGTAVGAFKPNVFIDISSVLGLKISAFEIYKSEVRDAPHPRSFESLRARAVHWGSKVGVGAAEAFILVRSVR